MTKFTATLNEKNVLNLNGQNFGSRQNSDRKNAQKRMSENDSAAIIWQAAQCGAGKNNTSNINRELRHNNRAAFIVEYLKSNESFMAVVTLESGRVFKMKNKPEYIEPASIVAGFSQCFESFYLAATEEKRERQAAAKIERDNVKAAREDLREKTAILAQLETERETALDNGAKALELNKRIEEAKAAQEKAKEAFSEVVPPVNQAQLVTLLNQAILSGLDSDPCPGLLASLKDLLVKSGYVFNAPETNEVDETAQDQLTKKKPSPKEKAANKKAA